MNKTVLITGTSSGIGKTAALEFASKGWNVVATMRKPAEDAELGAFGNILATRLDVQDCASIEHAIAAGIAHLGTFEATPREKIQEQFDVNVFGVMDVTRAILPHFRKNKGDIVVKIVTPHGGVTSTRFSERSAGEGSIAPSLTDYDVFVERTNQAFAAMRAARSLSSADVARAIYDAATDGTDRLPYLVGDDSRGFVKARQELSEEGYMEFMRSRFRLPDRSAGKSTGD